MSRYWWAIPALLASAAGRVLAQTTLPVDSFTHPADLGWVEIAPDGKFLAATYEVAGESRLAFLNLEQLGDVKEIVAPPDSDFHDFQWISPTRVLYRLALRQPGLLKAVTTGELLAVERDATQPQYVYGCRYGNASEDRGADAGTGAVADASAPAAPADDESTRPICGTAELLSLLPRDDRRVLVAEYLWLNDGSQYRYDPDAAPAVALLDTYDGSEQLLARLSPRGGRVLVDSDGRPRFTIGRDESDELAVTWQPQPEGLWQSFALRGFATKGLVPVKLSVDAGAAIFIGRRTRDSRTALYRLDLASHAAVVLYQHAQVDVASAVENLAGDAVIGVRVEAEQPEYHWLAADDPSVKLYESLQRAFPGQDVEITSVTSDLHQAIALVQSDVNPGDYYLVDTQTRHAQYLRSARSWVDPARMHHKEPIALKARDGLTLHGYLTRPRAQSGPFQLVVVPHGGPYGARDGWRFDWEAQLLAEYGYAVLQVNYRGSGGYGENFLHAGFREWGGKMQDDLTDATQWAIAQGIAARGSICIFGTGYGGYAAVMGAIREPGLYQCAAAYNGLFDLELVLARDDPRIAPAAREYLDEILGTDASSLRARSPVDNVAALDTPLLIMAAGDRNQIEYRHAGLLEAAMKGAGKSVETAQIERPEEVYTRLLEFLSRYLRAKPRDDARGGAIKAAS